MSDDRMLGRKIKGYQVAEILGQGGMGAVYRAQHPLIGKQVAIKILQGIQSPTAISRFVLEAKAVNDIRHENLIDILDFDELEEGNPYIIMEYLEGQSLTDAIHDGPFSLAQVGHIGLQLCSALSAAHQKGVIHRDLKGDNIFLITRANQQNFVKVLDFGIAKLLDGTNDKKHQTATNSLVGTPLCMAPEQITGQPVGSYTDIYALGVLLYQMVTGRAPFEDVSPMVLLAMHVTVPPPAPNQFAPNISAALEQVILRCLEKKPEDRHESMSHLASALGEACGVDAALYLGTKFMSQRLFTSEAPVVKAPPRKREDFLVQTIDTDHALFQAEPTRIKAALFQEEPTNIKPVPFQAEPTAIKPAPTGLYVDPFEEELPGTTIPSFPSIDISQLEPRDLKDTAPNAAPEGGWASIDQMIASIDAKEQKGETTKVHDARPTTEMTLEEVLLLTGGIPTVKKKKMPPTFPLTLFLFSLLILGVSFSAWWFFFGQ